MSQSIDGASWRQQLTVVKDKVVEAEKRKELERKLQIQRTREGIAAKLAEDTPDELERRCREIENGFKAGGRELFPVEAMQIAAEGLDELSAKVAYYLDSMKEFSDLFPPAYRHVLHLNNDR